MAGMGSLGKNATNLTPGRRKKAQDQYFEVGKVGRKTGITLKDTGIRDEYGMEPMSGIFSSPIASPQRNGDRTLTSSDMNVQDSSAPDVNETLRLRNTPRMPPPRAGTPKHTHMGSPKRMSAARPVSVRPDRNQDDEVSELPANRVLNFGGETVHRTIEATSPFKPTKTLRRSMGGPRRSIFGPAHSPDGDRTQLSKELNETIHVEEEDEPEEYEQDAGADEPLDDGPLMLDEDDYDDEEEDNYQPVAEEEEITAIEDARAEDEMEQETPLGRKRPRVSGASNISQIDRTPASVGPSSGKKRNSSSLESVNGEGDASVTEVQDHEAVSSHKKKRSRLSKDNSLIIHHDDHDETIDPSLLAHGDEYVVEEPSQENVQPQAKGKAAKGKKAKAAPKERDPNRAMKSKGKSVELNDTRGSQSPSKRGVSRGGSVGPVSNVHLRATTPLEDSNGRTSRYGRSVIQPLKYWENETRIYRHGEIEGIVRADHVEPPKRGGRKKGKGKKKRAQGMGSLEDIAEESENESICADEWEEEVGVIAGDVAKWDPETQDTDPSEPIREDLAFASSAIQTRDVAGSEFKYAKILTLPFFGSGVVEIPPNGFKKAKNSRKMQMAFFVHEGKVLVDIGAPGMELNQFAITKGGVWVVPRGNTYAISNESSTKSARIFFAQGAEIPAGAA